MSSINIKNLKPGNIVESRRLLFSVTAKDCEWSYTRGTGHGGQAKNKTSSAVHCKHPPSGARGYAEDTRSQRQNRQMAFVRMTKTKEFEDWRQMEFRRRSGQQAAIDEKVQRELQNIKVEVKNDEDLWQEIQKDAILPDNPS